MSMFVRFLPFLFFCYVHARNVNVDVSAPWLRYDASFTAEILEFLG